MELRTENLIGNTYSAKGTKSFQTFNPITNTSNPWEFTIATEEEVQLATQKAHQAFKIYRQSSLKDRAVFLREIAKNIQDVGDQLFDTYCQESGLAKGRAQGECNRTLGQLETFAKALDEGQYLEPIIDRADPERSPIAKVDIRKQNEPIGPIVVFGASNFPLAYSTAGGDTASALACGCPVIVKAHPMHAATGALVANAILKAVKTCDMPDGVFSNLNSNSFELGKQLVKDPYIKGVGFTGSISGGTSLYQLAQSRTEPIPVFAEMGSVNPVIVLAEAIEKQSSFWAKSYADSITLGSGQFCTNPGLIFCIEHPKLDKFISELADIFSEIQNSSMLNPSIHKAYEEGKESISEKANLIASSKTSDKLPYAGKAAIYEVDAETFSQNPRLHQEVFGPMSLVIRCKNIEQLTLLIDHLEGQLTGTILGSEDEISKESKLVESLKNRVGRIIFNGVPTGVEVCPAMLHGGPFPASTDARFTAVGIHSMKRWLRPIAYQNWPKKQLPDALKDGNPLGIIRLIDNQWTKDKIYDSSCI